MSGLRRFFARPLLLWVSAALLALSFYYLLKDISAYWRAGEEPLLFLAATLRLEFFVFIAVLILSFEFLSRARAVHLDECIASLPGGLAAYYRDGACALFLLVLLYSCLLFLPNYVLYFVSGIGRGQYLLHLFFNQLVNFVCLPALAIAAGAALSLLRWRPLSYLLIVLGAFILSPVRAQYLLPLYEASGSTLVYDVGNLFDLFTPNLGRAAISSFGYSLLPYRLFLIAFWLSLSGLVIALKLSRERPRRWAAAALATALAALCLLGYFFPASKIVDDKDNPKEGLFTDAYYYWEHEQKESAPDFSVLAYDMDFEVGLNLKASVRMELSDATRPVYHFTLYHGYVVSEILDAQGRALPFRRAADALSLENLPQYDLSALELRYSGYALAFFSNVQGLALPGLFPYYPKAGLQRVFSAQGQDYTPVCNASAAHYTVRVRGAGKVYSNLPETGPDRFSGICNDLTLVSGMYDSLSSHGLEIVYPYLERDTMTPAALRGDLDAAVRDGLDLSPYKKIIFVPAMNRGALSRHVAYSDHLTVSGLTGLAEALYVSGLGYKKEPLFGLLDSYRNHRDIYEMFLESQREMREMEAGTELPQAADSLHLLMDEKIRALGEDYVLAACDAYLADSGDTRDCLEFLKALE